MKKKRKQDRIRVLERFRQGESVTAIANSLGYSRRWVYKWIARSRVENSEVPWPEDQSRRPHANPRRPSTSTWWRALTWGWKNCRFRSTAGRSRSTTTQ